jgi:hypothetical protein
MPPAFTSCQPELQMAQSPLALHERQRLPFSVLEQQKPLLHTPLSHSSARVHEPTTSWIGVGAGVIGRVRQPTGFSQ